MRTLVVLSVVLGVAYGQFPMETPEVQAARHQFMVEYNRLAELAALAPDIHIYHRDPNDPRYKQHQPGFNAYSFEASLGDNKQFQPGPNTFPAQNLGGHLAGHRFTGRQPTAAPRRVAPRPAAPRPVFPGHRFPAEEPIQRWTGPLADDTPAGVGGTVIETPSVIAAKNAHFQAHAAHYAHLARFNPVL